MSAPQNYKNHGRFDPIHHFVVAPLRPVVARALGELGVKRAWVVRSVAGLDEVSPSDATRVTELDERGALRERVLSPDDFGLGRIPREALAGSDAPANAAAIERILRGEEHPATVAVVLNAAAARLG